MTFAHLANKTLRAAKIVTKKTNRYDFAKTTKKVPLPHKQNFRVVKPAPKNFQIRRKVVRTVCINTSLFLDERLIKSI